MMYNKNWKLIEFDVEHIVRNKVVSFSRFLEKNFSASKFLSKFVKGKIRHMNTK